LLLEVKEKKFAFTHKRI